MISKVNYNDIKSVIARNENSWNYIKLPSPFLQNVAEICPKTCSWNEIYSKSQMFRKLVLMQKTSIVLEKKPSCAI